MGDTPLKPKLHTKITNLVGHRPLIKFIVNDKEFERLWDTSSMISLISRDWLRKQFKDTKINSSEFFLGTKATDLKIKAADNTKIDIDGIVTFNFCISNLNDSSKVPFIATKQNLSTPVIGFNIIEHLVKTYPDSDFINPILNSAFPHLNCLKTEVLVNLVQEKNNPSDFVGAVRNFENLSIPANSISDLKVYPLFSYQN